MYMHATYTLYNVHCMYMYIVHVHVCNILLYTVQYTLYSIHVYIRVCNIHCAHLHVHVHVACTPRWSYVFFSVVVACGLCPIIGAKHMH